MHRRFEHPSVSKLNNVLKRTTSHTRGNQTYKLLKKIQKYFKHCQTYFGNPRLFRFTLQSNSILFNHSIYCDILTIEKEPVLHVADKARRFQAACHLVKMSAEELRRANKSCWINV